MSDKPLPYQHLQDQSEKGLLQILIDKICCLSDNITNLNNNEYKLAVFQEINAATGTVTAPTGSTILLNQVSGGVDAFVSTIDTGQPTGNFPRTSASVPVDVATFDGSGNFTLSGTPSSYPVALIYWISIKAQDLINAPIDNIIEDSIWYNISPNEYAIIAMPFDSVNAASSEMCGIAGSGNFENIAFPQRRTSVMTHDGVFSSANIITASAQPGTGALTLTLYKNGVATSIVVTVPAGASGGTTPFTDSTHYVSFSAGDYFYWIGANAAASASAGVASLSLKVTQIK